MHAQMKLCQHLGHKQHVSVLSMQKFTSFTFYQPNLYPKYQITYVHLLHSRKWMYGLRGQKNLCSLFLKCPDLSVKRQNFPMAFDRWCHACAAVTCLRWKSICAFWSAQRERRVMRLWKFSKPREVVIKASLRVGGKTESSLWACVSVNICVHVV